MRGLQLRCGAVAILIAGVSLSANAQSTCGAAVAQLQQYVVRVNAFATGEYYRGIPARCGLNSQCSQWWLGQLNAWYMQQSQLVNGWYARLSAQCTSGGAGPGTVGINVPSSQGPGGLDESAVSSLQVDDEDKTVVIKIPSNPQGFR